MDSDRDVFTLMINAGGGSRRMGRDKASLVMPNSGMTLLWHIVVRLASLPIEGILVVTNCQSRQPLPDLNVPCRTVLDAYPNGGALGGLATGLAATRGWSIVVACDMPLVDPEMFGFLCNLAVETDADGTALWDAVVPMVDSRAQTMHALYHRRCLPVIVDQLESGNLRVADCLERMRVRWVHEGEFRDQEFDLTSFTNINTPTEWRHFTARLVTPQVDSTASSIAARVG